MPLNVLSALSPSIKNKQDQVCGAGLQVSGQRFPISGKAVPDRRNGIPEVFDAKQRSMYL
jgi:hypothetical protein